MVGPKGQNAGPSFKKTGSNIGARVLLNEKLGSEAASAIIRQEVELVLLSCTLMRRI